MAKSALRLQARELRRRGVSVKTIARKLGVAKSSASLWVRDIILSIEQQEKLKKRALVGAERGRLLGALKQKSERLERIEQGKNYGKLTLENLTDREICLAAIALYWAEGNKKMKRIEFCNSDPKLILFLLTWFQKFFHLNTTDFKCYVGVNIIHRKREEKIKNYWSSLTGIPLQQFTKTSFKKSKQHKIYENFNQHYGTLSVKVLKPARILYKMTGLVEALRSLPMPE